MEDCLVLNPGYQPVARVDWQKAVLMMFKNRVEVVEEQDCAIRSVTVSIKAPSVIRLLKSERPRKRAIKFTRENIWARDNGKCQYCGTPQTRASMTYDHVVPRSQGGKTIWENIVSACVPCNQKKGGRTPEQAEMKLRVLPIKPKKLPDNLQFCIAWQKGMPVNWKQWLIDVHYWHGALDE